MKIVSYNVMIGGVYESDWKPTPGRLSDVMKVIRELDPDVLGLQETLSFKKRREAERCAVSELRKMYEHEIIFDDDTYKEPFKTYGTGCALFSKKKPRRARVIIRGKTRAVEMIFGDVSISCVYLSHEDEDKRREQVKLVLDKLGKCKCKKHRIIMGDFNAISPEDKYERRETNELIGNPRTYEKYFKRTNNPAKIVRYEYEKEPRKDTIRDTYRRGYLDAAVNYYKRRGWSQKHLRDKTAYYDNDSVPVRMDYFFVTTNLLKYINYCGPRKYDFVQKASDHFPWELNLDDSLFE